MSGRRPEILAISVDRAQVACRRSRIGIEEKPSVSMQQKHKLFQQFLVAATSLCVGVILARAMGF
jgi:hypothetical protein